MTTFKDLLDRCYQEVTSWSEHHRRAYATSVSADYVYRLVSSNLLTGINATLLQNHKPIFLRRVAIERRYLGNNQFAYDYVVTCCSADHQDFLSSLPASVLKNVTVVENEESGQLTILGTDFRTDRQVLAVFKRLDKAYLEARFSEL